MTNLKIENQKKSSYLSDDYINYRLRNARKEMGLNINNLGILSSVNISLIYNYEQLKHFPGKTNAKKISDCLKKDPNYLFPKKLEKLTDEVKELRRSKKDPLDNAISLEDLTEEHFPKSDDDPVEIATYHELQERINSNLRDFTYRSKYIIDARYGLRDGQDHILKQLGKIFKLSKERIRQIEKRVLNELRKKLTKTPSKL